jgi:hypothetical protein
LIACGARNFPEDYSRHQGLTPIKPSDSCTTACEEYTCVLRRSHIMYSSTLRNNTDFGKFTAAHPIKYTL